MTGLALALLVKSTVVLAAGACAARVLQSCSASIRHLVWLSTLAALLIMPLGLLIPTGTLPKAYLYTAAVTIPDLAGTEVSASAPWLTLLWAAGFALRMVSLANAARRAIRLVRSARKLDGSIRVSDDAAGPLAWSFGNGAIILPAQSGSWSADEMSAVVRHEAAHVARRDCQALLVAELACAVYWFHPMVWYAARRMRIEQEHAADDCVLQEGILPADYAMGLVSMASADHREQLLAGAGVRSLLAVRIEAILDRTRRRTMLNRRLALSSAAAALLVALPLAAMQAERQVYKIGGDVTAPVPIYKEEVQYTPEAKDARIEGTVLVSVIIEANGTVSDIRVIRGLEPGLDKQAILAVEKWRFKPAMKDGAPVAISANIEVNFRLK
jgi:TonB family protein